MEPVCVKDALKGLPEKIDPLWIREEDGWQTIKKVVAGDFGSKLYDQIPDGVGDEEAIRRLKKIVKCQDVLELVTPERCWTDMLQLNRVKLTRFRKAIVFKIKGFCPTFKSGHWER